MRKEPISTPQNIKHSKIHLRMRYLDQVIDYIDTNRRNFHPDCPYTSYKIIWQVYLRFSHTGRGPKGPSLYSLTIIIIMYIIM